ncbi:hypothetical protein LINPERPRIM_LOCUS2309 [Linum perenne]
MDARVGWSSIRRSDWIIRKRERKWVTYRRAFVRWVKELSPGLVEVRGYL